MGAGYDGTIKIDTRIDTKGMNKGTQSLSSSLGGVMRTIKGVGAALGLAFSGAAVFNFIKNTMASFNLMASSAGASIQQLNDSFAGLKGAIANALLSALVAILPYIMSAIAWLTQLFNIAAQVISILFGVQTSMAGVASGAGGASGGVEDLAKETKKAEKAAKGALAAFDQINVLATGTADEGVDAPTAPGAGGGGGGAILPPVPTGDVFPGLAEKIQAFKDKVVSFLQPVIDAFQRLKDALIPLGQTIWEGLKWAWDNIIVPMGEWTITDLLPAFLDLLGGAATVLNAALLALQPMAMWLWENFLKPIGQWAGDTFIKALGFITDSLYWLAENMGTVRTVLEGLMVVGFAIWLGQVVSAIYLMISGFAGWIAAGGIAAAATAAFGAVMAFITSPIFLVTLAILALIAIIYLLIKYWPEISKAASDCWTTVQQIWFLAGWFFEQIGLTIKTAFDNALNAVKEKFESIFNGIQSFVTGIVNSIIDVINGMIDGVESGINAAIGIANSIASIVPGVGQIGMVSAPRIPHLATGAVIPPNAQFAAILGDQRSGRNLEAPEGVIRQIMREEMGRNGGSGQTVTIRFEGNMAQFVRELKPYIDQENGRIGGSLIMGAI